VIGNHQVPAGLEHTGYRMLSTMKAAHWASLICYIGTEKAFSLTEYSCVQRNAGYVASSIFRRPLSSFGQSNHALHQKNALRLNAIFDDSFSNSPIPLGIVVAIALSLGVGANIWIQQLLSGDRGLGNFLSDGPGFGQSKFQPLTTKDQDRAVSYDPLPWLKLPKLDFVEVAGQDNGGNSRKGESLSTSTSSTSDSEDPVAGIVPSGIDDQGFD
jgi:hypothetical protein